MTHRVATMILLVFFVGLAAATLLAGCAALREFASVAGGAVGDAVGVPAPAPGEPIDWVEWVVRIGALIGWGLYGKRRLEDHNSRS